MPGISDALSSSANNMRALERSLASIQSNIGNASTPGYARQDLVSIDSPSSSGALIVRTSRDEYAEQSVRQQNSLAGRFDQLSSVLQSAEPGFGPSADAAIPKAIGDLFATFSGLTANPNDTTARRLVLDQAAQLAGTFNSAATTLQDVTGQARQQVTSSVDSINRLAALVRDFNVQHVSNASSTADASVDAKLNDTLEQLSEFGGIQLLKQNDGSMSLLLNGQTALVAGQSFNPIQADLASGPGAIIRDSNGADITSQIMTGRLGGALDAVNRYLPAYRSGLDQLAQGIADSVNTALANGLDSNGNPGAPLFTYQVPNIARTLSITGIGTGALAAAAQGAPGGNGNALALAGLETSPAIGGLSFAGFYGNLAAQVGRDVASASDNGNVQKQLLAQARAQRSETSGVSLDEEALRLVEYQRAYQAAAKMVSVLDQLSEVTINMIQ